MVHSISELSFGDDLEEYLGMKVNDRLLYIILDNRHDIVTEDDYSQLPELSYNFKYLNSIHDKFQTVTLYNLVLFIVGDHTKVMNSFINSIIEGASVIEINNIELIDWIEVQMDLYLPILILEQLKHSFVKK
ncbi:hypothetical protein K502DRAFT_348181 [Neoconidiobolus thromboides FSU 785]|nr:hypothetical protein K502DRAFT_348181 [Neoconidiobolus thromboides FSU 785]